MPKTNALVWICLLFIICQHDSLAQDSTNTRKSNSFLCAAKAVGSDIAYVFTSPLRMTTRGGVELLALSALTTGFVLRADDKIDEELALEGYEFFSQPFRQLAKLGQVSDDLKPRNFAVGLTATTFAGGLALRDKKLLQTSRLLVEATVLTQLFTSWSKGIFGRGRPYRDLGPRDFNFFKCSFHKSIPAKSLLCQDHSLPAEPDFSDRTFANTC